uniref:LRRcap domain-containing protein n=1 Tax=Mesocestoides corti TaxID=53468 RepID=A0A5K3FHW6_MESCO
MVRKSGRPSASLLSKIFLRTTKQFCSHKKHILLNELATKKCPKFENSIFQKNLRKVMGMNSY